MSARAETPELRLFDALFRLNKFVLADVRRHISALGDLDLGDFLTLRNIELGVDTPGGLARDLAINPAMVSRTLTKLVKAGLVDRRIDAGDSRRSRLELTKAGLRINAAIAARIQPALAQRLGRLNAHQIESLLDSFAILTADLGQNE